jgi:hypothetical protein
MLSVQRRWTETHRTVAPRAALGRRDGRQRALLSASRVRPTAAGFNWYVPGEGVAAAKRNGNGNADYGTPELPERAVSLPMGRRGALVAGSSLVGSSLVGFGGLQLPGLQFPGAEALAEALPLVPKGMPFGQVSSITPSAVIKGCWQLSGYHKGDKQSDRT